MTEGKPVVSVGRTRWVTAWAAGNLWLVAALVPSAVRAQVTEAQQGSDSLPTFAELIVVRATSQRLPGTLLPHSLSIRGDGTYSYALPSMRGQAEYRIEARLSDGLVAGLRELLGRAEWPRSNDVTKARAGGRAAATLTLTRGDGTRVVSFRDQRYGTHADLLVFLSSLARQEQLLCLVTQSGRRGVEEAARELIREIDALEGIRRGGKPDYRILDWARFDSFADSTLAGAEQLSLSVLCLALRVLGHQRSPGAVDSLLRFLHYEYRQASGRQRARAEDLIRGAAIKALGRIGDSAAIEALTQACKLPRSAVLAGNVLLGIGIPEVAPGLVEAAEVSREAAWGLIEMGPKAEAAIISLLTGGVDDHPLARLNVLRLYSQRWDDITAPVSEAVLDAVEISVGTQTRTASARVSRYARAVLKKAGREHVPPGPRETLAGLLRVLAVGTTEEAKRTIGAHRIQTEEAEQFVTQATARSLDIVAFATSKRSAVACVMSPFEGDEHYTVHLSGFSGLNWRIAAIKLASPGMCETFFARLRKQSTAAMQWGLSGPEVELLEGAMDDSGPDIDELRAFMLASRTDPKLNRSKRPLPPPLPRQRMTAEEAVVLWEALASVDTEAAAQVTVSLLSSGDDGFYLLAKRIDALAAERHERYRDGPDGRRRSRLVWAAQFLGTVDSRHVVRQLSTGLPMSGAGRPGDPDPPASQLAATMARVRRQADGWSRAYMSTYRDGSETRHQLNAEFVRVIVSYREVIAALGPQGPVRECRQKLLGLFKHAGRVEQATPILEGDATDTMGTPEGSRAAYDVGVHHMGALSDPARAMVWFSRVTDKELYLKTQQQMIKCEVRLGDLAAASVRADAVAVQHPERTAWAAKAVRSEVRALLRNPAQRQVWPRLRAWQRDHPK